MSMISTRGIYSQKKSEYQTANLYCGQKTENINTSEAEITAVLNTAISEDFFIYESGFCIIISTSLNLTGKQ